MKKVVLGCLLLATGILIALIIISYGRKEQTSKSVYTIPKELTYWYQEDKTMTFEIFLNEKDSLIQFPNQNTYELRTNSVSVSLNHVDVSMEYNCNYKNEEFYCYKIKSDLIGSREENMHLEDVFLEISNRQYRLNCLLGNITIYKESYPIADISDLYGQYSYIDQELILVGLMLRLEIVGQYLNEIQIGSAYGNLEWVEADVLKDSEMDSSAVKHPILAKKIEMAPYFLDGKSKYYFIPISYEKKLLITNACVLIKVDGKEYIIDNFTYYITPILLSNYPISAQEGRINDA